MTVALCLAAILVAFVFVWRGLDVRFVLFTTALAIGVVAGQPQLVFRKIAETLADGKFILPICSAMGFAYVVRETGAVGTLVQVLVRPIERVPRLLLPAASFVALVVNMAIPSQASTLAAVGPLEVALMSRVRVRAADAGTTIVFGASIAGALLNPGLAEVTAIANFTKIAPPVFVVSFVPGVLVAFAIGMTVFLVRRHFGTGEGDAVLEPEVEKKKKKKKTTKPAKPASDDATTDDAAAKTAKPSSAEAKPSSADQIGPRWKALLPPLPIMWLLLSHPALPTSTLIARVVPPGLEVLTAMLAGSIITILLASRDRQRSVRTLFDGMGWALANIVSIIAISTGVAKALELAGVFAALVRLVDGHPSVALALAFLLTFTLAVVSGSATAASVALVTALGPRAHDLGVDPLRLGGVILFGAEAGRTTSPGSAVLLFGAALVKVPARTLAQRLAIPCIAGGTAGAMYWALH
jgi:C4-dicarboxylate transporter, DcuC family